MSKRIGDLFPLTPSWLNTSVKLLVKGLIYWGVGLLAMAGIIAVFIVFYCLGVIAYFYFEPIIAPISKHFNMIITLIVLPLLAGLMFFDVEVETKDDKEDDTQPPRCPEVQG